MLFLPFCHICLIIFWNDPLNYLNVFQMRTWIMASKRVQHVKPPAPADPATEGDTSLSLDGADPGHCVTLTHNPSVHVYYALKSRIESASNAWLTQVCCPSGNGKIVRILTYQANCIQWLGHILYRNNGEATIIVIPPTRILTKRVEKPAHHGIQYYIVATHLSVDL